MAGPYSGSITLRGSDGEVETFEFSSSDSLVINAPLVECVAGGQKCYAFQQHLKDSGRKLIVCGVTLSSNSFLSHEQFGDLMSKAREAQSEQSVA